jgi:ribose transport system permease protein
MGRPTLGDTMLMDVIGATVIGGTSMFGGKGKVVWTLYGVIFYCILSTSLTHLKLDSFTVNVVKGVVIILAATLDVIRSRIQQQNTTAKSVKKEANEDE